MENGVPTKHWWQTSDALPSALKVMKKEFFGDGSLPAVRRTPTPIDTATPTPPTPTTQLSMQSQSPEPGAGPKLPIRRQSPTNFIPPARLEGFQNNSQPGGRGLEHYDCLSALNNLQMKKPNWFQPDMTLHASTADKLTFKVANTNSEISVDNKSVSMPLLSNNLTERAAEIAAMAKLYVNSVGKDLEHHVVKGAPGEIVGMEMALAKQLKAAYPTEFAKMRINGQPADAILLSSAQAPEPAPDASLSQQSGPSGP